MAAVPSIGRAAGFEPQQADAGATQDLYERHAAQVYGFCVNRLGSRDEAEDATQSTFLNAHRALQRGVTPEAELAWLFKIAQNVCLTRRRSLRRRKRVESPSDLGALQDVLPAPARDSADELIRLTDALSHMPDNQRRAILLREWRGLSYHEIADDLNVTQPAVETLIFRARRALAANLELEPKRPPLLARVRKAFDVGTLLAGFKTLFATSAAVKATAAAVAVSGAAVVATGPETPASKTAPEPPAVVAKAPAPAVSVVDQRPPPLAREAPAGREDRKPAAAAKGKARPGKSAVLRTLSPGQARKADVAREPRRAAKPARPHPAVTKARPSPKLRVVKAKPSSRPAPTKAKAALQQAAPAARSNGGGNGNGKGKGQSKRDG